MTFTQRKVGSTKSWNINLLTICLLFIAQWGKFPVVKIHLPTTVSSKNYITKTQCSAWTLLTIKKQGPIYPCLLNPGIINYKHCSLLRKESQREESKSWHIWHFYITIFSHISNFTEKGKVFHENFSYWKRRKLSSLTCSWPKYRQLLEELVLCCPISPLHSCHIPITSNSIHADRSENYQSR